MGGRLRSTANTQIADEVTASATAAAADMRAHDVARMRFQRRAQKKRSHPSGFRMTPPKPAGCVAARVQIARIPL
jgi:hypothetical protein